VSNKSKNILSGGPEGTINSKQIHNIPGAEDDVEGHGNNGRDGTEGVRGGAHGTVVGTYMHGPLLPKNTAFADWLTRTALGLDALPPLDDALEDAAHAEAARAAGVGG